MSIDDVYKFIPRRFTLANHEIEVEVREHVDGVYGDWNDAKLVIRVATHLEEDGNVELTEEQIRNSFYHEMFHAFMFFAGLKQDEMIAQTFANLLREYETSKK